MFGRRIPFFLLAAVHLAMVLVVVRFLVRGELTVEQAWFSLAMTALGLASLLFAGRDEAAAVLSLLLASLVPPFSLTDPAEVGSLGDWSAEPLSWMWSAFMFLFPYAFIHFTLIFPVPSRFLEGKPFRLLWIYGPYLLLRSLSAFETTASWGDVLPLVAFVVGFIVGLAIILRRYRLSLTLSEKNRLRSMLIGCLGGGLPYLISLAAADSFPDFLTDLAEWLLPFFPAALLVAVIKKRFSDIGPGFQRLLVYSTVSAGLINVFFLSYWAVSSATEGGPSATPWWTASLATLLLVYPLNRWGGAYVSTHFHPRESAAAARQEAVEDDFRPIRPNPYVVGNPVRSPHMFFGREEEFRFVSARLGNQREGSAIVLCGARRSGKSSILYQIHNGRLGPRHRSVFLDMQSLVVKDDSELLRAMAERIGATTGQDGFEQVGDYLSFSAFLDSALRRIGQDRLILLFDEYELLDRKVEQGRISREFHGYLNSLLERFPRLSLILTGAQPLEELSHWEPLLARSDYRKIGFLAHRDALRLIRLPLQGQVEYRSSAINEVWRLTRGHPFFTQLLCQVLVDLVNESRRRIISVALVAQAVERTLDNPPPQLFYLWRRFQPRQRLVLSALATLLEKPQTFLAPDKCRRLLDSLPASQEHELGLEGLRRVFEDLRLGGVLDRDRTRYRFSMDLIRLWIRNERSVWNVLNEIDDESSP